LRCPAVKTGLGSTSPDLLMGKHRMRALPIPPDPERDTYIGGLLDRAASLQDPEVFAALHRRVWGECQHFLDKAVACRERSTDAADRTVRAGETWLQWLGV